ncbi:endo-1,4-beta-xylanase [Maribellus sediminis]|uniref:endo-1,4-beta-xylanase n=1 Tax=Maribellus sediminis TaxID=2696285 RepID=UPI001431E3E0|nr:endo-1,4-beta-xylanase [Maribellus sediminis]
MRIEKNQKKSLLVLIVVLAITFGVTESKAQSYYTWYQNAQQRIDTLRKGDFGIKIFDKEGQPFTGDVKVRMKKHEFPFGMAFDFYEGSANMGNSYSTGSAIQADADHEIYQFERWNKNLGYSIPVEKGKEYKITLKFAEIYASATNARLFDVFVEGSLFLNDYDIFAEAGGKNIAVDTSITVLANDGYINIELNASKDNAAIKGIVVDEVGGGNVIRINCGGSAITTSSGNSYVNESGYFDPEANTVASNEQWMQATMYKYFNYGVTGNSFKWSGVQPNHTTPNYSNFENALRWTQKVGWKIRGHNLLWGGNDGHSTPDWVRNLPTTQAFIDTCKMRVIRDVSRYKGQISEYDVVNEPLSGHADWMRKTHGDSIIWNSFKWARSADPDAGLFVNDYNVEYNWGQAAEYRDLILKIKENGGPITGVGMQAHFWDCCRPNVDELVKNINIIAQAGLPIRLTEYDFGGNLTEAQQAEDLIKVLTIAFSHPSVTGMISWVLRDSENENGWRPSSGYFNLDATPKLAADTLLYYTKKLWATNFDSRINSGSTMNFNAYYGDYEIEVAFGDTVKIFTIPCLKENADSVFILNEGDAKLKGPQFVSTKLVNAGTVKVLFNKPINVSSLVRSNFKFFSNTEVGLLSVERDPDNENAILLALSKDVTKGDYISVSYFPGNLSSTDGSKADAFGPEAIANPDNAVGISFMDDRIVKVYPNPASDILNIEYDDAPYQISLFNSVGVQVYSGVSNTESFNFNVNQYKKGLYLLRIVDSENNFTTQKILLK